MGDLRTEKSEEAIRAAFFELVRERGFERVTVGELCRRARVGRSTFYDHHEDKYELLSCLVGEVLTRAQAMMEERFAAASDVAAVVGGAYAWFESERDELSCLLTIHVPEADLAAQFRALLEEGFEERLVGGGAPGTVRPPCPSSCSPSSTPQARSPCSSGCLCMGARMVQQRRSSTRHGRG